MVQKFYKKSNKVIIFNGKKFVKLDEGKIYVIISAKAQNGCSKSRALTEMLNFTFKYFNTRLTVKKHKNLPLLT